VARAAAVVADGDRVELAPDLAGAFDRFMTDPLRTDPTCAAKTALVEALARLDAPADEVYLRGIRHRQPEPIWGGTEDTAAPLRAAAAQGLARSAHPDAPLELARLLADSEVDARIGAARALARSIHPGALSLLWHKAVSGDGEAAVMVEVYGGLLALDPERAIGLVGEALSSANELTAEAAALALGESRQAAAYEPLAAALAAGPEPSLRRGLMLALALLRTEEALARLLAAVRAGSSWEQRDALAALAMFRDDEPVWSRVEAARRERD
jgi:HEAT repeat protein